MTVSLCMIVWNEEDLLAKAIGSTEGLADEVVIVDTGSTDNTVALAKSLGARVIEGADRMHKGQSRNQSLEAATGDWCFVLDADETVRDPHGLRAFLDSTDAQAAYLQTANMNGNNEEPLRFPSLLCWRRGAYQYKYRAHEVPFPVANKGKIARTDFVIEHRPPPERQSWKPQYFLDRLLLDVQENPGDGRSLFYLGRQYTYNKDWQKALDIFTEYLKAPGHDHADALGFMASCYEGLGQHDKQVEMLYRACAVQPSRRDWWGRLGERYHADKQYRLAIGILKCALEIQPNHYSYVSGKWFGPHIYDLLARCLWNIGRIEEGGKYARKAWELEPENPRLQRNLGHFNNNRIKQAFDCITELWEPKSILYIGANRMREPECVEALYQAGHKLTLLEIWPDNANHYRLDARFENVILGDVRTADLPECEIAFWWHGPEHVEDPYPAIARLEQAATRLVILGLPWGYYKQGAEYGNEHEIHASTLYPEDLRNLGYMTAVQGAPDVVGNHILAWKRIP